MDAKKPIIHVISVKATQRQIQDMASFYGVHIKVAVDIERGILAGGGEWHADCENELLQNGSKQRTIWGGGYKPLTGDVDFYALINIRPRQDNPDQYILSSEIREKLEATVHNLLDL